MSDLNKYSDNELLSLVDSDIEKELKARGYEYGWHKKIKYAGDIYILVNPAFKNLVKIGYADNVEKRVKQLSGSSVPDPYHVYAVYKVKKRLEDLDLHKLIDSLDPDLRHSPNKEFYEMEPEKAYGILSAIAQINGDEDLLVKNPFNDPYFGTAPTTVVVTASPNSKADQTAQKRIKFWTSLNNVLARKGFPFNQHKPLKDHWYNVAIGSQTAHLYMEVIQLHHVMRVGFLCHDKSLFDKIAANKTSVETEFGNALDWQRLDTKKSSKIVFEIKGFDIDDESKYESYAEQLIDATVKLRDAIKKYL